MFINAHRGKSEFNLSRDLSINGPGNDKELIIQKFETTYRTVTATKENPHMDDFMILDTEASNENTIFISSKGMICTSFANIAQVTTQNKSYLSEIRNEFQTNREIVTQQNEPESVVTVDITPEVLINKLNDVQLELLPKEVIDVCRNLPVFKVRELLDNVAKGKQNEANSILQSSGDIQILLRESGKFTDYSGRTFHCTAYEYAYWAKDTHMCRMLESHMDDETKTFLLEKINTMEQVGLAYQQHGISYQNSHYDMSFVLRNLTPIEFSQVQSMVGQYNPKIQQSTADNYKNISFTATEYEALKKNITTTPSKRYFFFLLFISSNSPQ